VLEIQNYADSQLRDAQIIQHQATFVVRDSIDDFCVDDNGIERDQIGHKQTNFAPFIQHIENGLLPKGNLAYSKFHDERVFIWLFNDAVAKGV
jgi:hypothetical protein